MSYFIWIGLGRDDEECRRACSKCYARALAGRGPKDASSPSSSPGRRRGGLGAERSEDRRWALGAERGAAELPLGIGRRRSDVLL